MEVPRKYLTAPEAAQYLRIRKQDFLVIVKVEKIRFVPASKGGRLFDVEDLDRFYERHKVIDQGGR